VTTFQKGKTKSSHCTWKKRQKKSGGKLLKNGNEAPYGKNEKKIKKPVFDPQEKEKQKRTQHDCMRVVQKRPRNGG